MINQRAKSNKKNDIKQMLDQAPKTADAVKDVINTIA